MSKSTPCAAPVDGFFGAYGGSFVPEALQPRLDEVSRAFEDALKDLRKSYKYSEDDYETLYYIAMCYKNTGDMDKATPYFYDIINNSGDSDLIRRASNTGLNMLINAATEAAKEYEEEQNGGKKADSKAEDDADEKDADEEDADEKTTEDEEDEDTGRSSRDADDEEE